ARRHSKSKCAYDGAEARDGCSHGQAGPAPREGAAQPARARRRNAGRQALGMAGMMIWMAKPDSPADVAILPMPLALRQSEIYEQTLWSIGHRHHAFPSRAPQ